MRERKALQARGTAELKLGGWRGLSYFPVNMAISCLRAHKVILLWDKDRCSFQHVIWVKWKTDKKELSFTVSSHSNWTGSPVGKMSWGWLFPWWTNMGKDDGCGCLLGHRRVPGRSLTVSSVPGTHRRRNQDNCPFYPLSLVTHPAPPLSSSGRGCLPLEENQLLRP